MSNDSNQSGNGQQLTQRQELEKLTLRQILDKKEEYKKRIAKDMAQLSSSLDKKSERKKAGKLMEKVKENLDTMILLDEIQDQKDE